MAVDVYVVPGGSYWQLAVTQQGEYVSSYLLKVFKGLWWPRLASAQEVHRATDSHSKGILSVCSCHSLANAGHKSLCGILVP